MSSNNRFFLDEESQLFIDLNDVQFMWLYPSRALFEMKLSSEKEVLQVNEPVGKKIFQALKAYRSQPPPPPQDPRVANAPWLSERQKGTISSVIASFGPSPLKPGVIAAPEARINQLRESCGVPFMRPIDSDSNSLVGEEQAEADVAIDIPIP